SPFGFPRDKPLPVCGFCGHLLDYLGTLDFRGFQEVPVPCGSLVAHVCNRCGAPADREAWATTWLREGEAIVAVGDTEAKVDIGTRWFVTEYLTPNFTEEDVASNPAFRQERGTWANFSCYADKIGGQPFFIQGDCTPVASNGRPMQYVGQFLGTNDIEIG